jgi:hypothetical protein
MNRINLLRIVVACLGVVCVAAGAAAQDFSTNLGHFRVVPRLSVLHRTGGFAGVSERLRLSGEYDLEMLPLAVFPPHVAFDDAEVWGSLISDLPHPAIVEDVDELLNLEGLHGRQLPVAAPFDAYAFKGETLDGSTIELFAAVLGPWMYVRGGTTPPPGSADFFEYQLRMVARSKPSADLNDDGKVDAADYTLLRSANGGASILAANAGITFADWREQYGEQVPDFAAVDNFVAGAASSFAVASAVPEPAAAGIAAIAIAALLVSRRRTGKAHAVV